MNLTLMQLVASLCMNFAGDQSSVAFTVGQIARTQAECHGFYAKCLKAKKPIEDCMIERDVLLNSPVKPK